MADNIESNKDFVLLSTNLNGYKTSDDSNDKNLVFTKKEFERFENRYDLVAQKQIDSIQLDYNAYKQPISNELNYKPTTNQQIQYNQEFTLNNNKNNLNYDWSIGGTQPPNNYQYGYANQTFIQNQPNYHEYTNQYNSAKYSNNYVYPYNQTNGSYENDSYPNNLNYSALRNTNQSNYTNQNYYDTNANVPTATNNISNGMAYQFNQNTLQYYPKERVNSAVLTTNPTVSTSSTSIIQPYVTSIDQQNVSQYQKEIDSMFYVNKPNPVIHNSNINQINVNNQLTQQQNPNFGNQSRTTKQILQNNKNNSLQSPSSSSPTSTIYSSLNGNNENQENVSTDEDESDIDESEEEDDDEDDDDEEVNEKNSKKLTTNQMNAPWIQSGKKISRKQTKKKLIFLCIFSR
jgi:hypothetical protein